MKLENLNLVGLDSQEMFSTNGGTIGQPIGMTPGGALNVGHAVVDFFHGFWNGIVGRN